MPSQFNSGDTVNLKSGGPNMTADRIDDIFEDKPRVDCTWFDGKGVNRKQSFSDDALEIVQ